MSKFISRCEITRPAHWCVVTRLCALATVLAANLFASQRAFATEIHRYDFEQVTGSNTEPGWTHMDLNILGTPTTPGFIAAEEGGRLAINRAATIQLPSLVLEDEILDFTSGPDVNKSDLAFRDIIPAGANNVQLTIYRNDTSDSFTANFVTKVSINGGALTTIDSGIAGNGFYHAPINVSLPLSGGGLQTLDFFFYDNATSSTQIRINGIQTIFSFPPAPEPSSLVLWGLMAGCFGKLRRGARSAHSGRLGA